ncbi:endonuclease [Uliginosibacterium sp. 31-16]|uniref:endonuclease n=1 Tax=Uliginosibacterium sp. 31-16 TaxID=3068315 RepID=UPI00273D94E2|nr:endonuclease [Uliginosibacterium sp. 31-16]MDP5241110.1 endonuclease [Uliginosibacterium sp. 31-16]
MRYLLLLFAVLLPIGSHGKGWQSPRNPPNILHAAQAPADTVTPVELVNSKKQVGHRNFSSAKKVLPSLYEGMGEEFYCGCRYTGKAVDLQSCGFIPRKNANRASRIEWEHIVPAAHMGSQRQCWQKGGRKGCSGKDPLFDMMEGDLNNLVPAVGEVNGDRSDMSYGIWTTHPQPVYGRCQSLPDFKAKRFQPRPEVRGRAARISLYMHTRYRLAVSNQDRKLWCAWAKAYPVDQWEQVRNRRVIQWQGEGNPLVEDAAKLEALCR